MKRSLTLTAAGMAAAGLVLALVPALPAAALDPVPCAQMGGNTTILNTATPVCTALYTSGSRSVQLPSDGPRIVYGVVNLTSSSAPASTFTTQGGQVIPMNPTEGRRWMQVGSVKAAQTLVRGEIVNGRIGKAFPYVFISDDALVDRFANKTFIGKTNNAKGSKNVISIWTRIDWAGARSDTGLQGVIANYKQNVLEQGQCKPAMTKQHKDMVKQRFGEKGKLSMTWVPGLSKATGSYFGVRTETKALFTHPAPTALQLTQKLWKPGKINYTLSGSDAGLMKIVINDIRGASSVTKCSLKP